MLQIDIHTDSRQEILQDGRNGVYQKIVDLKLLKLRKEQANQVPVKEEHPSVPQHPIASSALFMSVKGNSATQYYPQYASGASLGGAGSSNKDFSQPFNPSRYSGSKKKSAQGHQ